MRGRAFLKRAPKFKSERRPPLHGTTGEGPLKRSDPEGPLNGVKEPSPKGGALQKSAPPNSIKDMLASPPRWFCLLGTSPLGSSPLLAPRAERAGPNPAAAEPPWDFGGYNTPKGRRPGSMSRGYAPITCPGACLI